MYVYLLRKLRGMMLCYGGGGNRGFLYTGRPYRFCLFVWSKVLKGSCIFLFGIVFEPPSYYCFWDLIRVIKCMLKNGMFTLCKA